MRVTVVQDNGVAVYLGHAHQARAGGGTVQRVQLGGNGVSKSDQAQCLEIDVDHDGCIPEFVKLAARASTAAAVGAAALSK
jgi:hypothetical protein